MSRRRKADPVEQFFLAFFAILIVGTIVWSLVPHWVIYAVGGVLLVAVAVGVVLRVRGGAVNPWGAFDLPWTTSPRDRRTNDFAEREAMVPLLNAQDRAMLIEAVGGKCENPRCRTRYHQSLQIHHIIPRTHPRCTNMLDNLLVLCPNCHANAGNNQPGRNRQQLWASNRRRFERYYLVRNWDRTH